MNATVRAVVMNGLALLALCGSYVAPGVCVAEQSSPQDVLTHAECAARIVKELGWQAGLPAEPKPADYLAILAGLRHFRFEAEEVYNVRGDNVSVRSYPLYGPFSGKGWINGPAVPTTVRFSIFLPRAGDYRLAVISRGDGQRWRTGEKVFTVSTGSALREAIAGQTHYAAGAQEVTVELPPEGGVDSFSLTATSDFPAIEPLGGWRPDSPLTWGEYAEAMASLLGLEKDLQADPAERPKPLAFRGIADLPPSVTITSADFLGTHVSPQWVRAGAEGAVIEVPVEIPATGIYGIRLRLLGKRLAVTLDGRRWEREGKPFLDWFDFGVQRLKRGTHVIKVELPSQGGADVVELAKRKSSPADYVAVIGLPQGKSPKGFVSRAELESQLTQDVARFRAKR
ncbi:MAG: hypothetical protein ED859_09995 [Desulfuromonadales bacterium]|nr:MAG: hypothetical protein ED859_09995 [Desulfuromonadales bacterium]